MSNTQEPSLLAKLQQLSPEQREALLKKIQQQKRQQNTPDVSQKIVKRDSTLIEFPLSAAQQRLWFLEQLSDSYASYNIAAAFKLHGNLNTEKLAEAFNIIINKYESLRTHFPNGSDSAIQKVKPTLSWQLPITHCKENDIAKIIHTSANIKFNLAEGPLFNIQLLTVSYEYHVLVVVMHHIISDAWSTQLLLKDVSRIYHSLLSNSTHNEAPLTLQYIDYTLWQQHFLQSEDAKKQIAYWQSSLSDFNNLDFPIDKIRPAITSYNGANHRIHLDKSQTETLKLWCRQHGITLFTALFAAYQTLLFRYTQQDDFCVGIPVANRHFSETENIMGFFVNSLAIRCDVDSNTHFAALCKKIQDRLVTAHSNQDIPFEKLVTVLDAVERNTAINPIFQTFFTLTQDNIDSGLALTDIRSEYMPANIDGTKFDLSLNLRELSNGIECHFEYNRDLFHAETIDALAQHFINLTQALITNESLPIKSIPFLLAHEIYLQTDYQHGWNATQKEHDTYQALQQLFESSCEKTPHAIAVADENTALSYKQLNEQANQLAHYLRRLGVKPNEPIAVYLQRSVNMSVALLAILKAGGAYVPLTTDLPHERAQHILNETRSRWLISTSTESLISSPDIKHINLDQSTWHSESLSNPICVNKPDDIFNIIYTSGSTGKPKGVMVPHQGIINRLIWMQNHYHMLANDKVLQKTPYNFDVSVWELFWPLICGASLFFAKPDGHKDSDYLITTIHEHTITHLHFVPSMLKLFLMNPNVGACNHVKCVFTSGEALAIEHSNAFFTQLPHVQLHNLYGPTEASIDVSYYPCKANENHRSIPIGKPIDNTQLHILDRNLQLMPIGASGELYIGGIGLALGYFNQDELTRHAFIHNPYFENGHPSRYLYKTGDMARYLADGNIEYLGRNDNQVKIRGFRIELGEIEAQLRAIPGINNAAVMSYQHNLHTQLAAYLICEPATADKATLNAILKQHLPDYMLPNIYIAISELPLSANGKLNKKLLPTPNPEVTNKNYKPPFTSVEIKLADIWQSLLDMQKISIDDNFFDIGGHSLLAAQMLLKIRSEFNIELPLKTLFELNTIESLSKLISATCFAGDIASNNLDEDDFEEGTL